MGKMIKENRMEAPQNSTRANNRLLNLVKKILFNQEVAIFIPLVILVIVIGSINPLFFSRINISSVLRSTAFYGMIAVGVSLVIITGSIDISVGSIAAVGGCACALFAQAGLPVPVSIFLGLIVSGAFGLFNGIMVSIVKMNGFVVTIGVMFIARGIAYVITRGNPVYPVPKVLNDLGTASPLGISWAFFVFVILVVVFQIVLKKTIFGRQLYSIGDNREVAKLAGINVEFVQIVAFVISAVLSGLAGILLSAQLNQGMPQIGMGWELQVIAGTAIGGISLLGGAGSMIGTFLGILILAVLINGMVLVGMDPQVQNLTNGVVIILAVFVDLYRRKRLLSGK